jgi:feruloyl esterase
VLPLFLVILSSLVLSAQPIESKSLTGSPLNLPAVPAVIDCSALVSADISGTVGASVKISSATLVNDGRIDAYCRVQVEIDGYAKSEVHLPVTSWTQRFLVGGGMGASSPAAGFATMSRQDIGNRGSEDAFADNAQRRVDFAYRMVHLQVLASKALIARFYQKAPKFSYYNACSEPGREGMMEVQRFPDDFNGAVTGCPPINDTINNGLYEAWNIRTNTRADGSLIIPADKLPLLHKVVLDECDALDGAKDGIVSDPLGCHPKLTTAECKSGQDLNTCLTAEQIHVALELYRGAHDEKGNKLEPIGVLPGSELQWTAVIAPNLPQPGRPMMSNDRQGTLYALRSEFAYPALGTNWQLSELKFDRADFDNFTKLHYLYDATDPDLSAFYKAGHKLIIWQGLNDNNVLPAHAILYYTALQKTMSARVVDQFVRLYLLPGVGHCGGGDGPLIRDFLTPLQLWVERGIAPDALQASHVSQTSGMGGPGGGFGGGPAGQTGFGALGREGDQGNIGGPRGPGQQNLFGGPQSASSAKPDLTRQIYPYPITQKYAGSGDVRDAANFSQGQQRPAPSPMFDWWGANFYSPHYERWCTGNGALLDCKSSQ